jgi:hypothetical protein
MPPRGTFGIFVFAPSDGYPTTTNLLSLDASLAIPTRVLRFEVSELRHRTPVRLVRPVWCCCTPVISLQSWLCGSTKEPSGFLVNHHKRRELSVASANLHSWLGSHEVRTRPWFWGLTKKPSITSSCYSCYLAARTWLHWPPDPSNQAYLPSPDLDASPATAFCACSSHVPTPVKPQPTPAILSQELVHTTLLITHHTRKRPCTSPRTTQPLNLPLDEWIHNTHDLVTKEKRKRKEMTKRNTNKR